MRLNPHPSVLPVSPIGPSAVPKIWAMVSKSFRLEACRKVSTVNVGATAAALDGLILCVAQALVASKQSTAMVDLTFGLPCRVAVSRREPPSRPDVAAHPSRP